MNHITTLDALCREQEEQIRRRQELTVERDAVYLAADRLESEMRKVKANARLSVSQRDMRLNNMKQQLDALQRVYKRLAEEVLACPT